MYASNHISNARFNMSRREVIGGMALVALGSAVAVGFLLMRFVA